MFVFWDLAILVRNVTERIPSTDLTDHSIISAKKRCHESHNRQKDEGGELQVYEAELLNRCEGILHDQAHSRSCASLVDEADDLRCIRAGEHFLVFLDQPDEVVIVDILHSRGDLPRHVTALMALKNEGL